MEKCYPVYNQRTGVDFGFYEANPEEKTIMAMCTDAGADRGELSPDVVAEEREILTADELGDIWNSRAAVILDEDEAVQYLAAKL